MFDLNKSSNRPCQRATECFNYEIGPCMHSLSKLQKVPSLKAFGLVKNQIQTVIASVLAITNHKNLSKMLCVYDHKKQKGHKSDYFGVYDHKTQKLYQSVYFGV